MRYLFALAALVLTGCGPSIQTPKIEPQQALEEQDVETEIALEETIKFNAVLRRVWFRLAEANADACAPNTWYDVGFISERNNKDTALSRAMTSVWGTDFTHFTVTAVFSPADQAGLLVGDQLVAIDGKTLPEGAAASAIIRTASNAVQKSGDPITLTVNRKGEIRTIAITPRLACAYRLNLALNDVVNAETDGQTVTATSGLIRFIDSDDELALVLGHELFHAIDRHVRKAEANRAIGWSIGMVIAILTGANVTNATANYAQSWNQVDFERAADYGGCLAAAHAGFDVSKAVTFWRRFAATHPSTIHVSKDHPNTAERYLALQQCIKEVAAQKTATATP